MVTLNDQDNVEDKLKADVILADKTLETLETVEIAQRIMQTKMNNDTSMWMTAMFRAILVRNSEYLWQERHSRSTAQALLRQVHEDLMKAYSSLEAAHQSDKDCDNEAYSDFTLVSSSLIKLFQNFTILLVKEKDFTIDLKDMADQLKNIDFNLKRYLKNNGNIESVNVPRSTRKAVHSDPVCAAGTSSSSMSSTSSEGTCALDAGASIPATARHEKSGSHRKCKVCEQQFIIYNNDENFSRDLHDQDEKHKKAVSNLKRIALVKPSRSLSVGDKSNIVSGADTEVSRDLEELKTMIRDAVGEDSSCIMIKSFKEFLCQTCQCEIAGNEHNILSHLQGKKHTEKKKHAKLAVKSSGKRVPPVESRSSEPKTVQK